MPSRFLSALCGVAVLFVCCGVESASAQYPFVDIYRGPGGGVRVRAPFVDVQTGRFGTSVRAPFTDVYSPGRIAPGYRVVPQPFPPGYGQPYGTPVYRNPSPTPRFVPSPAPTPIPQSATSRTTPAPSETRSILERNEPRAEQLTVLVPRDSVTHFPADGTDRSGNRSILAPAKPQTTLRVPNAGPRLIAPNSPTTGEFETAEVPDQTFAPVPATREPLDSGSASVLVLAATGDTTPKFSVYREGTEPDVGPNQQRFALVVSDPTDLAETFRPVRGVNLVAVRHPNTGQPFCLPLRVRGDNPMLRATATGFDIADDERILRVVFQEDGFLRVRTVTP